MSITELRTRLEQVTIGKQCDICGKKDLTDSEPEGWHHFNHNHNSWGNDSIESYEYFDVCSIECYTKQLGKCIDNMEGEIRAEIDYMSLEFAKALYSKLSA